MGDRLSAGQEKMGGKPLLRKIAFGFLLWSRYIMTGVIVLLAGILFGIVSVVGEVLDFTLKRIEKD